MDGNQNFEPTENSGIPKAVDDSAVAQLDQSGIATCSDSPTSGPETLVNQEAEPLTRRERFLESVRADLDGRYMLHQDGTIMLLGTRTAERICDALCVDRMEIGRYRTKTMFIVQRLDEDDEVVDVPILP